MNVARSLTRSLKVSSRIAHRVRKPTWFACQRRKYEGHRLVGHRLVVFHRSKPKKMKPPWPTKIEREREREREEGNFQLQQRRRHVYVRTWTNKREGTNKASLRPRKIRGSFHLQISVEGGDRDTRSLATRLDESTRFAPQSQAFHASVRAYTNAHAYTRVHEGPVPRRPRITYA